MNTQKCKKGQEMAVEKDDSIAGANMSGTVLIVQSDKEYNEILCSALHQNGLDIVSALDPEDALELFQSEVPELVLTGHEMGREFENTGLNLVYQLKELDPLTPVLLHTAETSFEVIKHYAVFPNTYYLGKPSSPATVIQAVDKLIKMDRDQPFADRRKFRRVEMDLPVKILGENLEARLVNLGAGGALIDLPQNAPVSQGKTIRLKLEAPGPNGQQERVDLSAQVVWANQKSLVGLKFIELNEAIRESLYSVIYAKLAPSIVIE